MNGYVKVIVMLLPTFSRSRKTGTRSQLRGKKAVLLRNHCNHHYSSSRNRIVAIQKHKLLKRYRSRKRDRRFLWLSNIASIYKKLDKKSSMAKNCPITRFGTGGCLLSSWMIFSIALKFFLSTLRLRRMRNFFKILI